PSNNAWTITDSRPGHLTNVCRHRASRRQTARHESVMPSPSTSWGSACACIELSHGEYVAFAVFEPGRLTDRGDRNTIHRAKARLVVLLELHTPPPQLRDLRLQVLDNPGGELMLGGPGARGGEQQEQAVLAAAVKQRLGLFLAGGESKLVR